MNPLRRLIREVHRRSVWQVLGIYLVGAWIGYQVVLNVMQGFGLPDWVAPFTLVLFVIGLPIVLATAFVQEGGPERSDFERRAAEAEPSVLVPGFSTAADELAAGDDTASGLVGSSVADSASAAPSASAASSASAATSAMPTPAAVRGVVRHLTWPKAIFAGLAAFLVLGFSTAGYMGLRNAGIGPMGSLLGKGAISERGAIVLANFTGDDVELATALTEAFRVDFEQSPIVRLVGPQQIADVLRRMQRDDGVVLDESLAREIAEREGYEAVVAGEVNPVGAGWVLSARLLSVDGRVLASTRETAADSTEVLSAIDALSTTLRERIGESFSSIRANAPLEQVTTSSLEALRRYTQAQRVRAEGDPYRALELLQQAIAIDSGFAMAWRKIGAISVAPGMDPELLVRATTRAWELRDRLTARESHLAAAAFHDWVEGDQDATAREYRAALDVDPDNTVALNNLAMYWELRGEFEEAARLTARAIEIGGSPVFFVNHAQNLYGLGHVDDARATLDRLEELFPSNDLVHLYRAALAGAEGDYDASDSIVASRDLLQSRTASLVVGLYWQQSANAAARGRLREALRAGRSMERAIASYSTGEALRAATWRVYLLAVLARDVDAAVREIDDALRRYPLADMAPLRRPYGELVGVLLHAGEQERADALIEQRNAAIPAEQRGMFRPADLESAVYRYARSGDLEGAEAAMGEYVRSSRCDVCVMPPLAEAHARAGDVDRAIELYERFLAAPELWRSIADGPYLGEVLFALGGLYEQRGDSEAAARTYGRFVDLWADADPAFQPRVRAAQERIEAIVARRG